jgi:hypothetical protein
MPPPPPPPPPLPSTKTFHIFHLLCRTLTLRHVIISKALFSLHTDTQTSASILHSKLPSLVMSTLNSISRSTSPNQDLATPKHNAALDQDSHISNKIKTAAISLARRHSRSRPSTCKPTTQSALCLQCPPQCNPHHN